MKVKCIDESYPVSLPCGNIYDVVEICSGLYVVLDETGDYSCWSPEFFEIVEGAEDDVPHTEFPDAE